MRSMRSIMRSALLATAASALEGIRNYRRLCGVAASLPVYRCASLEQATSADVEALRSVALVVDLRNDDEIAKGAKNRTAAAAALYEELGDSSRPTALSQRPLLGDVDAFWTGVAELSPPMPFEQAAAIFTTKPLNDALTRSLEDGGIPMMYKAILLSAPEEVGRAVGEVAACAEAGEPVVFHCQKGKDRTGLVAALVESVCGVPRPEIVAGYAVSGALLGGEAPRGLRGRSRRRRGSGRGSSGLGAAAGRDARPSDRVAAASRDVDHRVAAPPWIGTLIVRLRRRRGSGRGSSGRGAAAACRDADRRVAPPPRVGTRIVGSRRRPQIGTRMVKLRRRRGSGRG